MYVGGAEQVAGHEDVPRGAVLHEARQLRGQCDESSKLFTGVPPGFKDQEQSS